MADRIPSSNEVRVIGTFRNRELDPSSARITETTSQSRDISSQAEVFPLAKNDFIVADGNPLGWQRKSLKQTQDILKIVGQFIYDPDYKCYIG